MLILNIKPLCGIRVRSTPCNSLPLSIISYISGAVENNEVWDKRINAVNFDLTIDPAKYKENYLKTLKAYIDLYVARMAALPRM